MKKGVDKNSRGTLRRRGGGGATGGVMATQIPGALLLRAEVEEGQSLEGRGGKDQHP